MRLQPRWHARLCRPETLIGFALFLLMIFSMFTFSEKKRVWKTEIYQYQQLYQKYSADTIEYNFVIVADKDKASKNPDRGVWESILKRGKLRRDPISAKYTVEWEPNEMILDMKISEAGRGMELSELVNYKGDLLTFDDRTGIVSFIEDNEIIPYHILMDGNGKVKKGFKCEWASVKDGLLYVGSTGKEWTNPEGVVLSQDPQWVKTIDENGKVSHINWSSNYEAMRKATGAIYPGYLIHESGRWNPVKKKWYFFPRRHSLLDYDDAQDEKRGTNLVIVADEDFKDIKVSRIGPLHPTHGFSSFSFLPGRESEVVALQSEEDGDRIASYITVFNIDTGTILMEEQEIGLAKFEGIEIV